MQAFRVRKTKPKPPKSSKPVVPWQQRQNEVADYIEFVEKTRAMVACTECANNGDVCYYSREQSVKCAACLRHRRECDGTFSVEELRKIGEQKKQLSAKSRAKRREIARLRKTLASLEEDDADLQDSLAKLDEVSSNMLKREMQALGAFDRLPASDEVALSEPDFIWGGVPTTDSVDWDAILSGFPGDGGFVPGGTEQQASG